jgi:O-antigen ligase
MQPAKGLSLVSQVLYLIFLTSLVCSFRAVTSISIVLIFLAGIIKNKLQIKTFFHQRIKNPFLLCCCLLFCLTLISMLYTKNSGEGWNKIRLSSGLLITPLAICCTDYINKNTREKLLTWYCLILTAASLYCLAYAGVHYFQSGDPSHFFYHALVSPFKHHAVYFAILVFIALVFLLDSLLKNRLVSARYIHLSLIIFLSVFLFLLSSKLVILFYLLYLAYLFIILLKRRTSGRRVLIGSFILLVTISTLALTIRNPVSSRFYDMFAGDLNVIKQEKFAPANYFNGLQFRLLQWRFTGEILTEKHGWLFGVSPGDAQAMLDQKYISSKMYTGEPLKGTTGFLGYNTHNQFLETLLQSGIAGLFILLATVISLARMAWVKKQRVFSTIILLFLAWLFSESVLETQFGIIIFTFFPLFFRFD